MRLDCRDKLTRCMEISLVPRALIVVWMASIRCSLCGPPRPPLSFSLWSGLRSMSGAWVERIERLIETSGLEWTFLRPATFGANALRWWAPIDERDIAAVAVRALCEDGHGERNMSLP